MLISSDDEGFRVLRETCTDFCLVTVPRACGFKENFARFREKRVYSFHSRRNNTVRSVLISPNNQTAKMKSVTFI